MKNIPIWKRKAYQRSCCNSYNYEWLLCQYHTNYKTKTVGHANNLLDNHTSIIIEIIVGVPQGSILKPLLFNIFLNDLFLYPEETFESNYADNNTLYSIGNAIQNIMKALENGFRITENWLHENLMVLNAT